MVKLKSLFKAVILVAIAVAVIVIAPILGAIISVLLAIGVIYVIAVDHQIVTASRDLQNYKNIPPDEVD